jgi:phospholipid transport system substrate-binding protein
MKRYLTVPVIALILLSIWLTPRSAAGGVPTDQIKSTVDKALVVLKDPRFKPAAKANERREQLRQILFARFDFSEMGKRALGANWRRRTAKEQDEFVRLFTDLLERAYADTIESYRDEKILYVGERLDGGYAEVNSKVFTGRGDEYSLNYRVHFVGGEWRVYDVVVENISMVNNYRSQFNRVITNASYEELVRRLRDKMDFPLQKN